MRKFYQSLLLAGLFVFTLNPMIKGQSLADFEDIMQSIVQAEELSEYRQKYVKRSKDYAILKNGRIPAEINVVHEGRKVNVYSKEDLFMRALNPFIEVIVIQVKKKKAHTSYRYGKLIADISLKKKKGQWKIRRSTYQNGNAF